MQFLVFHITFVALAHCAKDIYRDKNNGFGKQLRFQRSERYSNGKYVTWDLGDDFKFFDKKITQAHVSISFIL